MKILIVIPRMGGGGAERVIANIANALVNNGYDVLILTLVSDKSFYRLDNRIILESALFTINRKNNFTTFFSLARNFIGAFKFILKKCKAYNPDCVISFLIEADILIHLVSKINNSFVHICSERNDPTTRPLIIRKYLKFIYGQADLLVCQGSFVYKYYSNVIESKKIIISNSVDIMSLPEPVPEDSAKYIVAIGRFFPQKNFLLLIESFAQAYPMLPKGTKLIIYGDGPQRVELEKKILNLGLGDSILLPGASKNIFDKIKRASLFVLSSDFEGYPNVLVEAMATGLPVISTDFKTGIAKELINKDSGILVPIRNKNKLAEALIFIMNNEDLRKKMRVTNIDIRNMLNNDKIVSKWIDVINSTVKIKGVTK